MVNKSIINVVYHHQNHRICDKLVKPCLNTYISLLFNPFLPPRPSKTSCFVILLYLMPGDFTCEGRVSGWERVNHFSNRCLSRQHTNLAAVTHAQTLVHEM